MQCLVYITNCVYDFDNHHVFTVMSTIRELCISSGEEHWLFNMYRLE